MINLIPHDCEPMFFWDEVLLSLYEDIGPHEDNGFYDDNESVCTSACICKRNVSGAKDTARKGLCWTFRTLVCTCTVPLDRVVGTVLVRNRRLLYSYSMTAHTVIATTPTH
jgi:hypothetical protein